MAKYGNLPCFMIQMVHDIILDFTTKRSQIQKKASSPTEFSFQGSCADKTLPKGSDNMSVDTERRSGGQFVAWPN